MKRISTLSVLKGIIALVLMFTGTLSASAQAYYMNVYQKDGSRVKYLVTDLDSIRFSFEKAPVEGVEYVDLGLSVNWATFNVGATAPEEYGDYYAWGEIKPKQDYSMEHYRYFLGYDSVGYERLSKYVVQGNFGYYGNIDGKIVLDEDDDVAYVKWGGIWRIPTYVEFEELLDKCSWEWVEQNGVSGYKITSNIEGYTDRSIFLPAAGFFRGELMELNTYGRYWSSSLYTYQPVGAYAVNFYNGDKYISGYYRNNGYSVRPVSTSTSWKGITSVSLDKDYVEITVGGVSDLSANLYSGNEDYSFMLAVTWSSDNPDVVAVNDDGVITGKSAGTAVITASCKGKSAACSVLVKDYVPVMEYVDLGLSVEWATCNIGAMRPDEYGYYFAWGEIEPKSEYTWSNYRFDNKEISGGYTKYNFFKEYGPVDYKFALDMEDDAARVVLGDNWRMPTRQELEELVYRCRWEWITMNGVDGYRVTGLNGNSIFLPAGGYRSEDDGFPEGLTSYLSSTLSDNNDGCAMGLDFYSNSRYIEVESRHIGELIRPVFSSSVPENVMIIQGIRFREDSVNVYVGTRYCLDVDLLCDSTGFNIRPTFSNYDIEGDDVLNLYEDGYFDAVGAGKSIVTATVGEFTASCMVGVLEKTLEMQVDDALALMKAYMSTASRHNDFGYPSIMMFTEGNGIDVVQKNSGYNWSGGDLDYSDRNNTYVAPLILWNTLYNVISSSNDVIGKIGYNTDDPDQLFALGQMLALRAFCYWNLAQLYQFNYVGNENKPCVPLITERNAEEAAVNGCARASVVEVYSQILNDLNNAIGVLTSAQTLGVVRSDKGYIDPSVAYGLRARVNLTMGEWRAAAADAQAAIEASSARPSYMAEASRPAFWTADEPDWMWGVIVNEDDDVVMSGLVNFPSHMGSFNYGYCWYNGGRQINKALYNSINSSDVRKGWWLDGTCYSANLTEDELDLMNNYVGYAPYTQVKFAPYQNELYTEVNANDIPLMRIEEMYLILAEGKAMSGANDEAKYILENFVKSYRDSLYTCPDVAGADLQDEIWRQRRIELWGEGLSWFDIMRLGKDVDRRGAGYEEYYVYNIPAGSDILLWRIPASVINSNPLISEEDNNPEADAPEPVEDYVESISKDVMVGSYRLYYHSYFDDDSLSMSSRDCIIESGESDILIIRNLLFEGSEVTASFNRDDATLVIDDWQFLGAWDSIYEVYLVPVDVDAITFHCSQDGRAVAYGSDSEKNVILGFYAMKDGKGAGWIDAAVGDVYLEPVRPTRIPARSIKGTLETDLSSVSHKGLQPIQRE